MYGDIIFWSQNACTAWYLWNIWIILDTWWFILLSSLVHPSYRWNNPTYPTTSSPIQCLPETPRGTGRWWCRTCVGRRTAEETPGCFEVEAAERSGGDLLCQSEPAMFFDHFNSWITLLKRMFTFGIIRQDPGWFLTTRWLRTAGWQPSCFPSTFLQLSGCCAAKIHSAATLKTS